jgi:hypothetical protein
MNKLTEAESLRAEYLDLLKTMYGTCLTGIDKAKAHMVGSTLGLIVTQNTLLGALFFLEDTGIIAILVLVSLLTFWWFGKTEKEEAKHLEAMRIHEGNKKRAESIKREYFALIGKELRGSFTTAEISRRWNHCSRSVVY